MCGRQINTNLHMQKSHAKMLCKNVMQKCHAKKTCKNVMQKCHAEMSGKNYSCVLITIVEDVIVSADKMKTETESSRTSKERMWVHT